MELKLLADLATIAPQDWNRLAPGYPFLRYEFLRALETRGCVGGASGWLPRYITAWGDNRLAGALPVYEKNHSYGEYVFDWAWAEAYARAGLHYYPKLVVAAPFTPATGLRILVAPGFEFHSVAAALIDRARALCRERGASSLHWLFLDSRDRAALSAHGFAERLGYQFHWFNAGYQNFDEFLAGLSAKKRKNLKRERRALRAAGVTMEIKTGADISAEHMRRLYAFYTRTITEHGGIAYLTPAFFQALAEDMRETLVLVFAKHDGRDVAGALNFRGVDTLYGRYWGSLRFIDGLHFETCYYTAIEYCIASGIQRFEAGAQGAHKIARGFVPTPTYSAHWLVDTGLQRSLAELLAREREAVRSRIADLRTHSPFKRDESVLSHESIAASDVST